ncbi:MAG: MFS transporter [Clostridia bacterium]|nr:MFS transporter [Clostridia bacterium]
MTTNKRSLGQNLAFAAADVFGGGSFNVINFLYVPFLTLVVGIPMWYVSIILLVSKLWDGFIDPFIGKVSDGKKPGKMGKRRYFMLIFAPIVMVGLVLLFFPWNLVTNSLPLKIVFVTLMYFLYATAQSFVLIPYYSHASELTDDYKERNKANAVRLAFSVLASLICVAVPGMIASPTKNDGGVSYLVMAAIFGAIFCVAILITALFSHERVITPALKSKVSIKEFFAPLKLKTYRQYLGMQMTTSMGMAVMSSFFFIFCDFYLRRQTYQMVSLGQDLSRFPIATIAAACMFVAQIFALPMYLGILKKRSKRFAFTVGHLIWIGVAALMLLLPAEGEAQVVGNSVVTKVGVPNWVVMLFGLALGLGIGGSVYVPHSSFGDVCNVGQLYFGKRTEGAFSGLTNFLNTTAQAIGLSLPSMIIAGAGYVETQYLTTAEYNQLVATGGTLGGLTLDQFIVNIGQGNVQLIPVVQSANAQLAIKLVFILLPIAISLLAIFIASRYKLTQQMQQKVVQALQLDTTSPQYQSQRDEILSQL